MENTILKYTVELTKEELLAIINNIEYANSYYPDDDDFDRDKKIISKIEEIIEEENDNESNI